LDAFKGFSFVLVSAGAATMCVARLQLPFFHFNDGSGQVEQYHADEYSVPRPHPLHLSIIS
jgi:hypothetical protein